jgi:hypothetical protein
MILQKGPKILHEVFQHTLTALLPALIAENSKGHTYITRFQVDSSLKQITHLHSVGILNSMSRGI